MEKMTVEKLIEKYGTDTISFTLKFAAENLGFDKDEKNKVVSKLLNEMADDLKEALNNFTQKG